MPFPLLLIIFWLQDMLLLDEQEGSVNFKFGVLYISLKQTSDDKMLSNGVPYI
jgi:hypothetical protein